MRRFLTAAILALNALLAGCTTPSVRSDVTVFQDWPADLRGSSFVFDRLKEQENDLEYRTYENLVRHELIQLGLQEAADPSSAKLKVALTYNMNVRDVRVVEPVVVNHFPHSPFYGPGWYPYYGRYYSPFYGPYYDPFWYGSPIVEYREDQYELFKRQLRVTLSRTADSSKVYDVTVNSEGRKGTLPVVMPYMIRSAFLGFPGKNGESRQIELPMKS